MAKQVEFLFYPLGIFFATVLTPFLFAGILFYFTVGLVDWLEVKFKRRLIAILVILLLLLLLAILFVLTLGPLITRQLLALLNTFPRFAEESYRQFLFVYARLEEYDWFREYAEHAERSACFFVGDFRQTWGGFRSFGHSCISFIETRRYVAYS